MTEIGRMIEERGISIRALSKKLNVTRYIIEQVMDHEPTSNAQREVQRRLKEFLVCGTQDPRRGIPVHGSVPDNHGLPIYDGLSEPEDFIGIGKLDPSRHFAVRVNGGWLEPEFRDCDMVICRKVPEAVESIKAGVSARLCERFDGRIVLVLIDKVHTTLSRLHVVHDGEPKHGRIQLRSVGKDCPITDVPPHKSLAVLGDVVAVLRKF